MTLSQFIKQETSLSNYEIAKQCKSILSIRKTYDILNDKQGARLCTAFKMFKALGIEPKKVAEFYKTYNN